ncbi:MAG: T9SS type A sorting domain-containing protein [Bacteroidota bacterium]
MSRVALIALVAGLAWASPPQGQTLGVSLGVFAEADYDLEYVLALSDGRVLLNGGLRPRAFASDGTPLGEFNDGRISSNPLTQLADGRVLITGSDDVLAFDPDGTYLGIFAERRNAPRDATQLPDGRVLIAEYGSNSGTNGRVSRWNLDGSPAAFFTRDAVAPTAVAVLPDGRVLVAESNGGRVSAFAPDGTQLPDFVDQISVFGDILPLPDGRVLISAISGWNGPNGANVSMFDADGTYLGPFTEGLRGVFGLALHPDGRVLVVAITEDRVYAYGVVPVAGETPPEAGEAVAAPHPNPVRSGQTARLGVTLDTPASVIVTVYDATGREAVRETHALSAGAASIEIPTAGLAAGVYAVRVVGTDSGAVWRLVIVR